jgi:hypothetical protein
LAKAKNQRLNLTHQISSALVAQYQIIKIGDVPLAFLRSGTRAKSALDSGLGMLKAQLHYKGRWAGRSVLEVDESNTTRTCSCCKALTGPTGQDMLVVRFWTCSACHATHDRDVNAAINVAQAQERKAAKLSRAPKQKSESRPGVGVRSRKSLSTDECLVNKRDHGDPFSPANWAMGEPGWGAETDLVISTDNKRRRTLNDRSEGSGDNMRRHDLEHIIRAAAAIANENEWMVIGSSSILGAFPDLPADACRSYAASITPLGYAGFGGLIDQTIGEQSEFFEHFGYCAQEVGPKMAILPAGWNRRLVKIQNANTELKIGYCLDPHDLAISKLAAGRDKDFSFVVALMQHQILSVSLLQDRLSQTDIPEDRKTSLDTWIQAQASHRSRPGGSKP